MSKAIFYHAGCPVCRSAEQGLVSAIDKRRYQIESVNLGQQPQRIPEAERAGVKSLPALVIEGAAYHINFGASLEEIKHPEEVHAGVVSPEEGD